MAFDLASCPSGWSEYASARDKTIIGSGSSYSRGATGGEASHTLNVAEMPSHSHSGRAMLGSYGWCPKAGCGDYGPVGAIGSEGGNQPHNNMQPYIALLYCRKN